MKKKLLFAALISTSIATAQTVGTSPAESNKKQSTVRIKKVKNVNGVETITDTTYFTSDPSAIKLDDEIDVKVIKMGSDNSDVKMDKMVIVSSDGEMREGDADVKILNGGEGMEEEIAKAMKEAGLDPNQKGVKKMVIVNEDVETGKQGKTEKKVTKIVMIKMNITDATTEDKQRLTTQIGNADNQLETENIAMYPNPSDGKFNLNFNLKNKGDAEITVFNMEGKKVFNEKLPNFVGEYNKPIDISSNNKGVYFLKIEQGKHAQVKKIVME